IPCLFDLLPQGMTIRAIGATRSGGKTALFRRRGWSCARHAAWVIREPFAEPAALEGCREWRSQPAVRDADQSRSRCARSRTERHVTPGGKRCMMHLGFAAHDDFAA